MQLAVMGAQPASSPRATIASHGGVDARHHRHHHHHPRVASCRVSPLARRVPLSAASTRTLYITMYSYVERARPAFGVVGGLEIYLPKHTCMKEESLQKERRAPPPTTPRGGTTVPTWKHTHAIATFTPISIPSSRALGSAHTSTTSLQAAIGTHTHESHRPFRIFPPARQYTHARRARCSRRFARRRRPWRPRLATLVITN